MNRIRRAARFALLGICASLVLTTPVRAQAPAAGRKASGGIRKRVGKHLTLFTDLPADPEVDELPHVYDQAYPQWLEYFSRPDLADRPAKVTGYLMQDKARFEAAGLLPADLPPFLHGYTRGAEIWWNEQPSAYYRRHLMLHEGTHSFMFEALGDCGPSWYMEGMAELLATHVWRDGKLKLNQFPASREAVPQLGRIKIVRDSVAAGRPMSLMEVMDYRPPAFLKNDGYAWSWAAAALLDGHPRYREQFRKLPADVLSPDFNRRYKRLLAKDWEGLSEEFQVFAAELEYGYDLTRAAIEFAPGKPLAKGGTAVHVAADRGWRSSGVRVERGRSYRLTASGRYRVVKGDPDWESEAGGVSVRYYRGRPLGMLLAAVRREPPDANQPSGLLSPTAIGLKATLKPEISGTLYFKINDSPAELADNAGEAQVKIQAD